MTHSTGNGRAQPGAIPDLIYPALRWNEADYATLRLKLEIYNDFVRLAKYRDGQVTEAYVVDPTELAAALAGIELSSGLLPRGCLFWAKKEGEDRLAIYIPPQIWPVTVRDEAQAHSAGSGQAWRVPLPGLILLGHGYHYSLWAAPERPTQADTPLYMAPCPNVHSEGVCRGSAPFPQAGPATMWQAVDAFFQSKFNRDLSTHKSKAFPHCVLDQWRALHQAGAEEYPLDDLVKTELTLGGLLDV